MFLGFWKMSVRETPRFAERDAIDRNRYRLRRLVKIKPNDGPPLTYRAELHPIGRGRPTDLHGWRRGTHRSTVIDPEPLAAPLGEAGVVSLQNTTRPGGLSNPNPTADLAGA